MKPLPKAKKKKRQQKSIDKKIFETMSKAVRLRDKRCVTCGATDNLQDSHYITRKNLGTAFHPQNNNAQCSACHMQWHRQDPTPYSNYMVKQYGADIFQKLYAIKDEWVGKKYPLDKKHDWLDYWECEYQRLLIKQGGAYD